MKKKLLIFVLLLGLPALTGAVRAQEDDKPLTKTEVLKMLTQRGPQRVEQSDIVGFIERRGIAFPADDKTLAELQRAGARTFLIDAVKRVAERGSGPAPRDPVALVREQPREQLPFLDQARMLALEFASELPDFVVTQVVTRSVQSQRRDWQLEDTLEVELTFQAQKGEQFKLLRVNGGATKQTYEDLDGSTSTGEFGTTLANIFLPASQADFNEIRREKFNGRASILYDFRVRKAHSGASIIDKTSNQSTIAGLKGSIWIDAETKRVLRVETATEDIPAGFPITVAETSIEYDWVQIGEGRYFLPVRAEVLIGRDRERYYSKNVIEFRNYHKFEAKIKVVDEKSGQ